MDAVKILGSLLSNNAMGSSVGGNILGSLLGGGNQSQAGNILGTLLGGRGRSSGGGMGALGGLLAAAAAAKGGQRGGGGLDMLGSLLGSGGGGGGLGGLEALLGGGTSQAKPSGGLGGLVGGLLGGSSGGSGGAGGLLGSLLGGGGGSALSGLMESAGPNAGGGQMLNLLMGQGAEAAPPQEAQEEAELIIEAMCNAAKSDGQIDEGEREAILGRLGELDESEVAFLKEHLNSPLDVQGFVGRVPDDMDEQIYAFSLMAVKLDTQKEAQYFGQLANGLGIDGDTANAIHEKLGQPEIFA